MNEQQHLDTLSDIKRIMERSTRFMSLSGLGGIGAGVSALIGSYFAWRMVGDYRGNFDATGPSDETALIVRLMLLAAAVLAGALGAGFYFTWRKAQQQGLPVWDAAAKRVFVNLAIPLITGGIFILGLLQNGLLALAAPSSLIFYGLGLVNASRYTVTDIRYLGYCEIVVGLIALFNLYNGLLFWALGFGVLHILYGAIMWWKYERQPSV
ncbi:hypothetical protein ACWKWU_09535 [Chitinophaga lutea]